jgi:hypothetical protein
MNQATSAIWGRAMAGAQNQWQQAQNLRPGFGSMSPFLKELQAGIFGRAGAAGQQGITDWNIQAGAANARNILEGQRMRYGVEAARGQDNVNRLGLMQGVRGQDVQRENALLASLARFIQPLHESTSSSLSTTPVTVGKSNISNLGNWS